MVRSAKTRTSTKKADAAQIHVLTDGTGGLPRHLLAAVMSQFPSITQQPVYHVFCSGRQQIEEAFRKIQAPALVLHSFAEPAHKAQIVDCAQENGIPEYDMTGGTVAFLAEQLHCEPSNDQALVHARNEDYFERIDAWEFTMQHDDSRRLESIHEADIVLLGVSRVSKTPTAAYLGWLGHRVANVSFAPDLGIPEEIKKCRKKVVALTMAPKRLSEIRGRRMKINGFTKAIDDADCEDIRYMGIRDTIRECMEAEEAYDRLRIPTVDVTNATVEETAARILELL